MTGTSEGQTAGLYKASFTVGSLARVGPKDGSWGLGIKISSDRKLMEVGSMTEGD